MPITGHELNEIEALLRREGVFCSSFPDYDEYSVLFYLNEAAEHQTDVYVLLDRNILGRIIDLARGKTATEDHRIAAAVMAFGQYADILFEPSVALQEGKATQSGMDADTELAFFRAADNSDPTHFANIALMRTDSLPAPLSPVPSAQPLTFPDCLSQYSVVYPIVLKIALIELDGGAMEERMIRFLDWMYESWIMSAVATNLAAICFSSSPPRGLFKHLRHSDRQFALKGLRNATWDLAYVMWWRQLLQRQSRENRLFLFCTRDRALMKIAKQLLAPPDLSDVDVQQNLQSILGARAYKHYWTLIVCSEKCRAIDRPEGLAESGLVRALEEALLRTNH